MTFNDSQPTSDNRRRFETLLQRYFEKTITSAETDELLLLWNASESFDRLAQENLEVHQAFHFLAGLDREPISVSAEQLRKVCGSEDDYRKIELRAVHSPFAEEQKPFSFDSFKFDDLVNDAPWMVAAPETKLESSSKTTIKPYRPLTPKEFQRSGILLAVVFALFFMAVYLEFRPMSDVSEDTVPSLAPIPSFAKVGKVADVVFPEDGLVFREGRSVGNEEIRLVSGLMELELENGVRIALEGPVTFHLQSAMKTFCERGRASVEVPPAAVGFETLTPFMNVRDLGTEFVVDVGEKESSVHVITGKVELEKLSGNWLPIPEGIGRVVDFMKVEKQIVANKKLYTDKGTLFRAAEAWTRKCLQAREERDRRWNNDPALMLSLDFDENQGMPMRGARIVGGRLGNEKAAEFRRKGDFVQTKIGGSHRKLTFMASVRINDLNRACNTILATDQYLDRPGFCWLIDNQGCLRLRTLREVGQKAQSYQSDPRFSSNMFGSWIDLAVTIDMDQREIVHYVDGLPVSTNTIDESYAISLREPTVGNWIRDLRTPTDRHFDGRIAAVLVFSRVLEPDEIRQQIFERRLP